MLAAGGGHAGRGTAGTASAGVTGRAGSDADGGEGGQGGSGGEPSECHVDPGCGSGVLGPGCGDGALVGFEECDDGNRASGDGCSSVCRLEPGYVCEGKSCKAALCGN